MTVYIIRRADGSYTTVGTPDNGNDDAVLRSLTADAGAVIVGGAPVPIEHPVFYCAGLRAERDATRAWADVDRAATHAAQDLRRVAKRAVARYRARKAQTSANAPDRREP